MLRMQIRIDIALRKKLPFPQLKKKLRTCTCPGNEGEMGGCGWNVRSKRMRTQDKQRRDYVANNVGAKEGIFSSMSVGYPPSTRPKVLSPG